MSGTGKLRRWCQPAVGAAILAVLVWKMGTGPFLAGLAAVDLRAVALSSAILFAATVCSAWRWQLVARALGLDLSLKAAVAASYRAQFVNSTLPGGVLGDVHRGVAHGRAGGGIGLGLRAVVWERTGGQLVQAILAAAVLLVLPSPLHLSPGLLALALVALAAAAIAVLRLRAPQAARWPARALRAAAADVRNGLLSRRTWPGVVLASALAVAGYASVFLIAARTAGTAASPAQLLPLAFVVLLAMSVPANMAGWGPREGVAAWAFGAAGLGAAQGVRTAVVYGVLSLAACLPGALVLATDWARARQGADRQGAVGRREAPHGAIRRPVPLRGAALQPVPLKGAALEPVPRQPVPLTGAALEGAARARPPRAGARGSACRG